MSITLNVLALWCFLVVPLVGWGSEQALLQRPPVPAVDVSGLPPSAVFRPTQPDGRAHPVAIRLLVDRVALRAGDVARVGLLLSQDPGWHTYWKSNTEIGKPTEITWQLPPGAQGGAYDYPLPSRYETQQIVSYGYSDQVLFVTQVHIPAQATPGPTTLGAKASWLTCESMCIPGQGAVQLPIQVVPSDAPPPAASPYAPLFDHFASRLPAPSFAGVAVTGSVEPSVLAWNQPFTVTLRVTPQSGHTLAPHQGQTPWPTFVPIAQQDAWFLEDTQVTTQPDGTLQVVLKGKTFEVSAIPQNEVVGGLLTLTIDGKPQSAEFTLPMPWPTELPTAGQDPPGARAAPEAASLGEPPASPTLDPATCATLRGEPTAKSPQTGLLTLGGVVAFALLGGLLLNVMPCVLPVLALKLYGLVEQQDLAPAHRRRMGLSYTAGVIVSFWVLAALVIGLQLGLKLRLGQGFQFQYPGYVAALATVVFVFGLSLFGVFELPVLGAQAATRVGSKHGPTGMFFSGVFATLLATPCSAPFLGSAMGFAFSQPPLVVVGVFTAVGFGLALPVLAVAYLPALFALLPRPGPWMETLKQFLGFTLIATAVWLINVLAYQVSFEATLAFISFLTVISFAAWFYGRFGGVTASGLRQLAAFGVAGGIAVVGAMAFLELTPSSAGMSDEVDGEVSWLVLDDARMASVLARYRQPGQPSAFGGKPIFIDFTAEWCLSCQVIEKTVLASDTVQQAMVAHDAVALKADWTNYNPAITDWLACFHRAGVPYYVVLPANPNHPAILLGEAPTPTQVAEALSQAASG